MHAVAHVWKWDGEKKAEFKLLNRSRTQGCVFLLSQTQLGLRAWEQPLNHDSDEGKQGKTGGNRENREKKPSGSTPAPLGVHQTPNCDPAWEQP